MIEKILNNRTPYGKIRASHEGSLHSSTLNSDRNHIKSGSLYIHKRKPPRFKHAFIVIMNTTKVHMRTKKMLQSLHR